VADPAGPRWLAQLLAPGAEGLGRLARVADEHARATRALRAVLPAGVAEHCVVASVDAETAVVQVDAGVWASRLRYLEPGVREALAPWAGGVAPRRVRVIVRPEVPVGPREQQRGPPLSAPAAETLERAAAATADGPLREALERLARRRRTGG
jgi:hypothetical protein